MKSVNYLIVLLSVFFVIGCSTTNIDHYSVIEKQEGKRALISDYHLKMSLIDRPIPKDQLMMLAFTEQRMNYQQLELSTQAPDTLVKVNYVSIRGDSDESDTSGGYSSPDTSIYEDRNAISLIGPK